MSTEPLPESAYIREMQVARGIGILLVTFGHSEPVAQVFPLFWDLIYSFHMPLFFFMSGFFSLRLINSPWLKVVLPRTAQLYVPYLVISLTYGVIKLIVPMVKRPVVPLELLTDIIFYPFDNPALFLWFLYILLLMKLLSPIFRGKGPLLLLPLFIISACWYGSTEFLGIWSLLKHLLFYNCGVLLAGHRTFVFNLLRDKRVTMSVVLVFPLLFHLSSGSNNGPLTLLTALSGIWLTLGFSFLAIPAKISRWLEYCGNLSLEIYLLQYFFIFPVLFTLTHVGVKPGLIVPLTFTVGLFGPIVVKRLMLDNSTLLTLVLSGRVLRPAQPGTDRTAK